MKTERLSTLTKTDEQALVALMQQLSTSYAPNIEILHHIVKQSNTYVYVIRQGSKIVATATLVIYKIPTGTKGWIEDVVVDNHFRGKGYGKHLVETLIDKAQKENVALLLLTSRPSRVAANKLYVSLGFLPKETNIYQLKLPIS